MIVDNRNIRLNRPQLILHKVNAKKTYILWARAGGKSGGGIGPRSMHLVTIMPGAQIGLVVPSYIMGFKQIIPNIASFWTNHMGLVEGENYVIGKKPPDDWPKPIIPVLDYKYVISFDNGTVMPVLSLEVEGSANGFNLQALIGDEAKFFNEKKLKEIIRAVRGCYKEFGHLAEFQSQWYFSDKYDGDVEWMLAKRKLMNIQVVKAVMAMQLEVDRMSTTLAKDHDDQLAAKIEHYQKLLTNARKKMVFVSEASAEENRDILGDEYFADQKEVSTAIEYKVAIENEDPVNVENCFYPDLNEHHYYSETLDINPNEPLIIAADYQWRIVPVVVAQYGKLPGAHVRSVNFVYSCYALAPAGLVEAIDIFCDQFKRHSNKIIYYMFDKTATSKNPTVKPYFKTMEERLRFHGWTVVLMNMGEPPRHDDKFKMIGRHLRGESGRPAIRINSFRNQDMITSINLSGAITRSGKTAKDKSGEGNLSIPAVKTTHFSDTFDMIVYACLELCMYTGSPVGGLQSVML